MLFSKMEMETEKKSYRLSFQYDKKQDEADKERRRQEQERYEEEHRYDDFEAVVHYDPSYKKKFFQSILGQLFYKRVYRYAASVFR